MRGTRNSRGSRQSSAALPQPAHDEAEAFVLSKELRLDFYRRIIIVRHRRVHLTPKEFDLLRHLVMNHSRPISHRRLLQAVWGPEYGDETELLRVVVNQLRKKIESEPSRPKFIQTEPCIGYRFVPPADARFRGAGVRHRGMNVGQFRMER
jgi:two-component system KDP operon response regulator KdpE